MTCLSRLALALLLVLPCLARADGGQELQALREEIARLRADYEARLQALEARLRVVQSGEGQAPSPPPLPAQGPGAAPAAAGGFNPAVSLILSGTYARTAQDPAAYRLRGIPLPTDNAPGPGNRGLGLGESELGLSASVDPWFRGAAHLALAPEGGVSVEEAYVQTTALGQGATVKAGRFLSGIGYLNGQHAHSWDFVDLPLAYQGLLGGQYKDDGLQLSWLAPTDRFVELRAELGRGLGHPASDTARNGAGMASLSAHLGDDVGDSHSWRAGLSLLQARATDQSLAAVNASGQAVVAAFTGTTRVWVADAVWKWAPGGNATRTSFTLQGEYLRSTRAGALTYDVGGLDSVAAYRARPVGWYLQGVYQFMPRWRAGLRTDRIDGGAPAFGANAAHFPASEGAGWRHSVMVDWGLSEFSRLRLQLAHDGARAGAADRQLWLQYQMSLGAHGAHGF